MNIVRINTYTSGGAALCVLRLHKVMIKKHINEVVLVAKGQTSPEEKIDLIHRDSFILQNNKFTNLFLRVLKRLHAWPKTERHRYKLQKIKKHNSDVFYTLPISDFKELANHPSIKQADIINLHWIGDFIDFPSFFKNVKKPIVWSLHDENAGRGCLHYECNNKAWKDKDSFYLNIKKESIKNCNITLVAQSEYMRRFCNQNELLKLFPVKIINNGVDTNLFMPISKETAREVLNIPSDHIVFAFSSYQIEDERKGLAILIKALENIENNKISLLCIGNFKKIIKSKIDIRQYGYISNERLISIVYSAANFYVLPSFYESFAKTPLEAMSCGTPVIAFPCSGTKDCINNENGVICEDFTWESLYKSILKALSMNFDAQTIRKYIEDNFTFEHMANQYLDLYHDILSNPKTLDKANH